MSLSIPLNPFQYPFHNLRRWLTQPVSITLFFLSPLLNIFRLDVVNLKLIFLGTTYPFAFEYYRWIPITFFAGVLFIAIISTLFGRLFCGWACPHNALTENTRFIRKLIGIEGKSWQQKKREDASVLYKIFNITLSLLLALILTYGMSTLILFYFISPSFWLTEYQTQGDNFVIIMFSQGLITLIGLFLIYAGHGFCKIACPYGLAQSLMAYVSAKLSPMEIRMQPNLSSKNCGSCKGCQTACPVDLDPRQFEIAGAKLGAYDGCFNCGDCIDACNIVQLNKQSGLESFLGFQFNPNRLLKEHPAEKL